MKKSTVEVPAQCIGLDLGDESSTYCVLDGEAKVVREGMLPTTRDALTAIFSVIDPSRFVLEASRHSHWVGKHLRAMGHEIIVANPRQLHLISKSTRKSDRNDAHLLARMGRIDVDLLQPVHERSDECLAARGLLKARHQLVRTRTRLVVFIRGSLKVFGCRAPGCAAEVFHLRARKTLPANLRSSLEPLLDTLETLSAQIERYDKEIERQGRALPQTGVLGQVWGVGPLISLAYAVTIEDPRRFSSSRAVGAYVGLTPRSYQSGASDPRLPISKQGDGMLRSLLVTAATHILRSSAPDSDLKRLGRRLAKGGTPRDKARARIAVARKLAVLLHRLWLTGEVYQPLRSEAKPT
jgi:transposase